MRASYLFTSRVGFRRPSRQGLRPDFRRDRRSVFPRRPESRHRPVGDPRGLRNARHHQQGGDRRRDPRAQVGHQRPDRERRAPGDQGHRLRAGRLPLEDLRHRDPAASAVGRHRAGRRAAAGTTRKRARATRASCSAMPSNETPDADAGAALLRPQDPAADLAKPATPARRTVLGPDAKSQVTLQYENGKPVGAARDRGLAPSIWSRT